MKDFKIIAITAEHYITGEPQVINDLFKTGLKLLHIRKPPAFTIEETKKLIKAIPEVFHPRIVLHNHYELLNDFNLKGIHLPEKVRKEGHWDSIKNIVSTSYHNLEDMVNEKIQFEYAFFSPVFQSISKRGYMPSVSTKDIKSLLSARKNEINFPVIALGGITDKTILQVLDMGFNGAACIGYLWENSNPAGQFNKLLKTACD